MKDVLDEAPQFLGRHPRSPEGKHVTNVRIMKKALVIPSGALQMVSAILKKNASKMKSEIPTKIVWQTSNWGLGVWVNNLA